MRPTAGRPAAASAPARAWRVRAAAAFARATILGCGGAATLAGGAASLGGAALLGCGGATFDGRTFDDGELSFRVGPVPRSWRRVDVSHALLAFRDDARRATIAVNGRCGRDGDDVPLEALTHHLFLHFTEREVASSERFPLDGREALRTRMVAKLDGVSKRFDVVVLKKDECVYDFVRIDDGAHADDGAFENFVEGFATTRDR